MKELNSTKYVSINNENTSGHDDGVQQQNIIRKRKRHFFNTIRAQMEFYFGDANLTKDRYLKQLTDKDPYVPLSVFLTFNKIKALTTNEEDIAKSLSNSQLLELDLEKKKVRRKIPVPLERCVDHKTLYVEAIPITADHDWLRSVFEQFGEVAYVSLPKYKNSNKIKEFGFVEYESEESVEKALNAYKEFGGVLCLQNIEPSDLLSVKSFINEQNDELRTREPLQISCKRKTSTSNNPINVKRVKFEEETTNECDGDASSAISSTDKTSNVSFKTEDAKLLKKKRRKKSGKSKKSKPSQDLTIETEAKYLELKILPKSDWKKLRNKYLNLQREKVSELKRKAWLSKQESVENRSTDNCSEFRGEGRSAAPSCSDSKPNEHKLNHMNMNFYGAGDDDSNLKNNPKDSKRFLPLERQPHFSFEPGLIVQILFLEPCVHVKEFKAAMRQHSSVKYVDVREGGMHSYIRLENSNAAFDFVRKVNSAEYESKILCGEEESAYWKKIENDREMKLNKQVKVPTQRGRNKIKKLLSNHIRFDDIE